MRVNVDITGEKDIILGLDNLRKDKMRKAIGEIHNSAIEVQTAAKERLYIMRSWDLGNLANSIIVELTKAGLSAEVGPTAPYGIYVEHGTKAHFPPPDALEGWAKRHGFESAWPICLAIARRGLKAKPFLFPAWLGVKDNFQKRMKELMER